MRRSNAARCDGREVVVIDDHRDTVEMIAEALEGAGARARSFTSAVDALASIEESPPDVVITDLVMPDMGGSELAARLRASPRTEHVALVALSGHVEPSVGVVRLFDAFLFKPTDPTLLPSLVETLAAQRGQRLRRVVDGAAPRLATRVR